jgi:hypothetical protein
MEGLIWYLADGTWKRRSALRTAEKHENFVGVGIGIGIDQKSLFPGILKPQRLCDPDSDPDPDTDNHAMPPKRV